MYLKRGGGIDRFEVGRFDAWKIGNDGFRFGNSASATYCPLNQGSDCGQSPLQFPDVRNSPRHRMFLPEGMSYKM